MPTPQPGEWTHSHEEDEQNIRVYRRTDSFAFPPTRAGRDWLRVDTSGEIVQLTPGPDDRPRPTGEPFRADSPQPHGPQVVEATDTLLKIRMP